MRIHILSVLCTLAWVSSSAEGLIPRVSKSTIQSYQQPDYFDFPYLTAFDDSDTLLLTFGDQLRISFDYGIHWEIINGIGGTDLEAFLDEFHQQRAFVRFRTEKGHEIHVTENEGKDWRKFSLLEDADAGLYYDCNYPTTNPSNEDLILLECFVANNERDYFEGNGSEVVYGSDDAGRSFRRVMKSESPEFYSTCIFAASKESRVKDNGVYCIETIEKSEETEVQYSNQIKVDSRETSFQYKRKSTGVLFYTEDLGKTKKSFDELNDFSVDHIFVLPSCVAVFTSDGGDSRMMPSKLWISKGTSFEAANLPEGALPGYVQSLTGDDQGRLSLVTHTGGYYGRHLLESDPSGLNFSFRESVPELNDGHIRNSRLVGNLKGTLWEASFIPHEIEGKVGWLQRTLHFLKNFFSKGSHPRIIRQWEHCGTKGSFDNGKTWTNLKIIDPSGKDRHNFKCDIDDVRHCSFQPLMFYDEKKEATAGIIMKNGVAGENNSQLWEDQMSFVSRDGGVSWELAFEYPVYTAILDFGNIIVAVPWEDTKEKEENKLYTKFYFSLDQGRTWGVYHFDKPLYADQVEFNSRGLKAYMGFSNFSKGSVEYVSYSMDFSNAFDGIACGKGDWETWYLSNGSCIDGKKYSFDRRKPDAKCLMQKTFEKLELHEEPCLPTLEMKPSKYRIITGF